MKPDRYDKAMLWLIGSLLATLFMVVGVIVGALIESWPLMWMSAGCTLVALAGLGVVIYHGLKIGGEDDR